MSSSRGYLDFIMDQLAPLGCVTFRAMMGEFIIYCRGKIVGGIYDDRFLVKPTGTAEKLLPDAPREIPYPGGSEMLLVEEVDDGEFLRGLVDALAG